MILTVTVNSVAAGIRGGFIRAAFIDSHGQATLSWEFNCVLGIGNPLPYTFYGNQ